MSAFENVELPMTILGKLNAKQRKKRAKHLLKRAEGLSLFSRYSLFAQWSVCKIVWRISYASLVFLSSN